MPSPGAPLRELTNFLYQWFGKPIVLFDCETTGTDVTKDRVIQFAGMRIPELKMLELLINPGQHIVEEVSEIHGITCESVANAPLFHKVATQIYEFLTVGDEPPILCGYNIRSFDIGIMTKEFAEQGYAFPLGETPVIDSCELFYKMQPRDLTGALKFYCGEELETAHSAMADVISSVKVLAAQLQRYEDLPHDPNAFDLLTRREKKPNYIDPKGKIQWWNREATFFFGKWKGYSLRQVYKKDRGYFSWILRSDFEQEIKDIIFEAYNGRFPVKDTKILLTDVDPLDDLMLSVDPYG